MKQLPVILLLGLLTVAAHANPIYEREAFLYINGVPQLSSGSGSGSFTEADPIWSSVSNLYVFGATLFSGLSTTGLITSTAADAGKFLRADGSWQASAVIESDPIWSGVSNQYATTNWVTNYVTEAGFITGEVDTFQIVTDRGKTTTNWLSIGDTDTSLLGIITVNDPIGPAGPFVSTNVLSVFGNIVPGHPNASLGTAANPWESGFFQNASLYMIGDGATNRLVITTNGDVVVFNDNGGEITTNVVVYTLDLFTGPNSTGLITSVTGDTNKYLRGDGSWQFLSFQTEVDPVFTNWLATGFITHSNDAAAHHARYTDTEATNAAGVAGYATTNWVTNYVAEAGFLTVESDPVFTNWLATGFVTHSNDASAHHIRYTDTESTNATAIAGYATTNWVTNYVTEAGFLTVEVDPVWVSVSNQYGLLTQQFAGPGSTGFLTSAVGDAGNFLRADGTWVSVAGGPETDPVWSAVSNQYATTNWVTNYVTEAGFITAEVDPIWSGVSNQYGLLTQQFGGPGSTGFITSAAGDAGNFLRADGTWVSVAGGGPETDPIFTNWLATGFITHSNDAAAHHARYTDIEATNAVALAGYATTNWVTNWVTDQAYLTVEVDPIWSGVSNLYLQVEVDPFFTNWVAVGFVTHSNDASAHHTRYSDTEATNAVAIAGYATTNWVTNYVTEAGFLTAEVDPVWVGVSNQYGLLTQQFGGPGSTGFITSAAGDAGNFLRADGSWVSVAGGGPETDPIFTNWLATGFITHSNDASAHHARYTDTESTNASAIAGYATTNWVTNWVTDQAYLTVEVDPIWSGVSNQYATTNWVTNWVTDQAYLTAEVDPVWGSVSNQYGLLTLQFAGPGSTGFVTSAAGDAGNFLRADGTWVAVAGGGPETDPIFTNWETQVYLIHSNDPSAHHARFTEEDVTNAVNNGTFTNVFLSDLTVSNVTFAGNGIPGGSYSEYDPGSGTTTAFTNDPLEIVAVTVSNVPIGTYVAIGTVSLNSSRSGRAMYIALTTTNAVDGLKTERIRDTYVFNSDENVQVSTYPRFTVTNDNTEVAIRISIDNTGPQATMTYANPALTLFRVFALDE